MVVKTSLACGLQKCVGNLWQGDDFSDFTVVVENSSFPCHRFILSACSGFFQGLFRSRMKECLEAHANLDRMTKGTFDIIINSLYKGVDGLSEDNVLDVWSATELLQIDYLIEECKEFVIQNLSVDNCTTFLKHAMMFSAQKVIYRSLNFIIKHFEQIRNAESFLQITFDYFYKVIASDFLATNSEDSVLETILKWVDYTPSLKCDSWLFTGTLDRKTANEILHAADISRNSLSVSRSQKKVNHNQDKGNYGQDKGNDNQEQQNDDQKTGNDGQEKINNDQENGNDDQEKGNAGLEMGYEDQVKKQDQNTEYCDQEKGNKGQEKGNSNQSATLLVVRNGDDRNVSECVENMVEGKSNIILVDDKAICNEYCSSHADFKGDRKQHFLKLISACRLLLVKSNCLENLLKNHIHLLLETGAYNLVHEALMYTLCVDRRHDPWPETAVHRASSSNKHVMVSVSDNKFMAYSLNTGSVREFAELPQDIHEHSCLVTINVFDNVLCLMYEDKNHVRSLSMFTEEKEWMYVSETKRYTGNKYMLLAHGSYIYHLCEGSDHNDALLYCCFCVHSHNGKWPYECTLKIIGNCLIRFHQYIVVFGTKGNVVSAHYYDTQSEQTHECTTSMDGTSEDMISFRHGDNVYILQRNGSLWKVFSTDTTPVDFELVSKLWDFNCNLKGCVLYKKKLFVFCDEQVNPSTLLTSLPGIYENIEMIKINSRTQCLPMVLPESWFTSS